MFCLCNALHSQVRNYSIQIDSFYHLNNESQLILSKIPVLDFPVKLHPDLNSDYHVNRDTVYFNDPLTIDTLIIRYRVFPIEIFELKGIDTTLITKDILYSNIEEYRPSRDLNNWSNLEYYGNFSRGLSFGNRESPGVQSNFDLNLKGKLGDDIELIASMTDNSIPLQPNGNTQRIQEFDNVFIRLNQKENFFEIGDLTIKNENPYFLNYNKKIQGVNAGYINNFSPNKRLVNSASLAVSKGKFARSQVKITEGNQGPYKLTVSEDQNEYFFVIAGSETVFLDGVPLSRGENNDYVIDYNLAELTFTSNLYIGTESRIYVEFEYNNQEYQNSLINIENRYSTKKWNVYSSFLSTQDMKNSFIPFDLDDQTKDKLSEAGDSESEIYISSIRKNEEGFDPNLVMYELIDSLGIDSVLVRSKNPKRALYLASFLYVGPGAGNYIRRNDEDNQAIFIWQAPLEDRLQGEYEPVFSLKPPTQQIQWSLGADLQLDKHKARVEFSLTDTDLNRFSRLDSKDNQAPAFTIDYEFKTKVRSDSTKQISWRNSVEHKNKYFNPINPYRSTEFNRDWDLIGLDLNSLTEDQYSSSIQYLTQNSSTTVGGSYLSNTDNYRGYRYFLTSNIKGNRWNTEARLNWLKTRWNETNGLFIKPRLKIEYNALPDNKLTFFIKEEQEYNRKTDFLDDVINPSFYYFIHAMGADWKPSSSQLFSLQYSYRKDQFPFEKLLKDAYESHNVLLKSNWDFTDFFKLQSQVTYRRLQILEEDNTPSGVKNGQNLLANVELSYNKLPQGINLFGFLQLGTGKEPKRNIRYIRVEPGKGNYAYIDFNDDGIQQVNEFVPANFQNEGEYIRVNTITNEFIDSKKMSIRTQVSADLAKILKLQEPKWYSRFSLESNYFNNRSFIDDINLSLADAFIQIPDSLLVAQNGNGRHALYYQKGNIFFQSFFEIVQSSTKALLTSGVDERSQTQYNLAMQKRISKKFFTQLITGKLKNDLHRETFNDDDFDINGWQANWNINYLINNATKFTLYYKYNTKKNQIDEAATNQNEIRSELTWSPAISQTINANIRYSIVQSEQDLSPSLENAMLNGLKKGNNLIWDLLYQVRIKDNIHLNFSYQGRRLGDEAKIIHSGNAQVTAIF